MNSTSSCVKITTQIKSWSSMAEKPHNNISKSMVKAKEVILKPENEIAELEMKKRKLNSNLIIYDELLIDPEAFCNFFKKNLLE